MQIKREQLNPTTIKLTLEADQSVLDAVKADVLKHLAKNMKLPGFRPGKAPLAVVERNADTRALQAEFLDEAINRLYGEAIEHERLRVVGQPKVGIQKFVPFSTLALSFEVEAVGDVKLPNYKKIKLAKKEAIVTDKDVDEVVESLRERGSERKDVTRTSKDGDEVTIDFTGKDAKTGEAIKGADGKGYPLILGSNTFIPGFESNLAGMKTGEAKEFTLTFPKDYGVKALQNRKVAFAVTVTKVQELVAPKADDAFAEKVGPFKSLADLKSDIRRQLQTEKDSEVTREFENQLLETIADKTTAAIPETLIEDEIHRAEDEVRRNLAYRGQTWQEFLDEQGQTEEEYRKTLREPAERRVKAGLALSEIAEQEGITVTPEEFKLRMQLIRGQYTDKAMQAELEKPENARQIISGMITEKTMAKLSGYTTAK
jgi:trigger factor